MVLETNIVSVVVAAFIAGMVGACVDTDDLLCVWTCIAKDGTVVEKETVSEGGCDNTTSLYLKGVRFACTLKLHKPTHPSDPEGEDSW